MTFRSSLLYAARLLFSKDRSNGRRSLLGAIICIGISIIPLIAVLSLSDGMIGGITGRIVGLSTQDVSVVFYRGSNNTFVFDDLLDYAYQLASVENVTGVYPEVQGTALASSLGGDSKGMRSGATVRAVEADIFSRNQSFSSLFKVLDGSCDLSGERNAVLGEKIAGDLGVKAGDRITLITASKNSVGKLIPKTAVFTVTGVVSCGYQELDSLWVFVPLKTGFEFLPNTVARVSVNLTTTDTFSTVPNKVKHDARVLFPYADVWTWRELNSAQYENFSSTKVLLLLVMLLILLVASVNISSALVMVGMERRREIAILKSVGGTRNGIALSFLITGAACGAGGLVIGLPVGLLAAVNINAILSFMEHTVNFFAAIVYKLTNIIHGSVAGDYVAIHLLDPAYYLQDIPVVIPFDGVLLIAAGTVLLSLFVSVLPAFRVAREKPLDTLRKA